MILYPTLTHIFPHESVQHDRERSPNWVRWYRCRHLAAAQCRPVVRHGDRGGWSRPTLPCRPAVPRLPSSAHREGRRVVAAANRRWSLRLPSSAHREGRRCSSGPLSSKRCSVRRMGWYVSFMAAVRTRPLRAPSGSGARSHMLSGKISHGKVSDCHRGTPCSTSESGGTPVDISVPISSSVIASHTTVNCSSQPPRAI